VAYDRDGVRELFAAANRSRTCAKRIDGTFDGYRAAIIGGGTDLIEIEGRRRPAAKTARLSEML
jgi:hypothetical protein